MSKNSKDNSSAFIRRLKIYEKHGLKPILVHKQGVGIIFSSKPTRKGDK